MTNVVCRENVKDFKGFILGLHQPVRLLICGDKDAPPDGKVIVAFVGPNVVAMVSTPPTAVLAEVQDIAVGLGANFAGTFKAKDTDLTIHCPPGLVAQAVVSQCWDNLEENLSAIIEGLAADPPQPYQELSKAGAARPSKEA